MDFRELHMRGKPQKKCGLGRTFSQNVKQRSFEIRLIPGKEEMQTNGANRV